MCVVAAQTALFIANFDIQTHANKTDLMIKMMHLHFHSQYFHSNHD